MQCVAVIIQLVSRDHVCRFENDSAGQTVHLQIKAEQKEILQNVLERKDSMAECYQRQRASERACVTFLFFVFGQGTTFFLLMVICNSLYLLLKSVTARFCLRSYDFDLCLPFFKHLSRDYEKTTITAMYHGK
jgi:hypothetical protein